MCYFLRKKEKKQKQRRDDTKSISPDRQLSILIIVKRRS